MRNNKKIVKKLRKTKMKDFIQGHSFRNRNKNRNIKQVTSQEKENQKLGTKIKELGT